MFNEVTLGEAFYKGKVKPHAKREPMLDSAEFANKLGLSSPKRLWTLMNKGEIPQPDAVVRKLSNSNSKKLFWRLSTVEKELKKRNIDSRFFRHILSI